MAEQFYTILTAIGKAKIANSAALGEKVELTHLALGDGDGSYYNPTEDQTALKNEVWRGAIGTVDVDGENPNWIIIQTVVPSQHGGFMIREAGVFDDDGDLIAIGKYPETYKPVAADGSIKDLIVRMILEVSNTASVVLKIDPTVILATQQQVDEAEARAKTYTDQEVAEVSQSLDAHLADYADLKGYIGYTEDDIYGVEADFVNNKFTRLAGAINKTPGADFDSINAFGGRRRCNLADDGTVNAYYGEPGYIEDGSNGQVMVEQPKFYYKVVPLQLEPITDGIGYHLRKARYYVSDTPKVGFKVHPAFVRNGVEVDKIYLSAYEGSIYDESAGTYLLADEQITDFNADKLSSIAYAKPASGLTQNLTRANTRKLAENRGNGWQISDVLSASVTQMLMMIEYAAFNMQSAIGLGVVNKTDDDSTNMSELTGATTNLGNASGMAAGTNGLVSISYRGEENFWGNIWKWIDGLNIYIDPDTRKTDAYWAAEIFADNTGSVPYKHVGFNLAPNTDGYVSAFGWSEECDFLFLPTETLGNSALPVGDGFYNTQTGGWQVARLGGAWTYGLIAGAFAWHVAHSAATRGRTLSGRLLYVPQVS